MVAVVSMNTIWKRKSAKAARVIAGALQQEALHADQAEEMAAKSDRQFMVQARIAAHGGDAAPSDQRIAMPPNMKANPQM